MQITLKTTFGAITLELDTEKAPATTRNFIDYAQSGFYNGTIFHRVIDGFMIQGGGFDADMAQKETNDTIKNEADNGLTNDLGTIAMARTSDPHSASAQFFINVADNDFLNHTSPSAAGWGYAVFGKVIEGLDVVQHIAKQPTTMRAGMQDVPAEDVVIESVEIN